MPALVHDNMLPMGTVFPSSPFRCSFKFSIKNCSISSCIPSHILDFVITIYGKQWCSIRKKTTCNNRCNFKNNRISCLAVAEYHIKHSMLTHIMCLINHIINVMVDLIITCILVHVICVCFYCCLSKINNGQTNGLRLTRWSAEISNILEMIGCYNFFHNLLLSADQVTVAPVIYILLTVLLPKRWAKVNLVFQGKENNTKHSNIWHYHKQKYYRVAQRKVEHICFM